MSTAPVPGLMVELEGGPHTSEHWARLGNQAAQALREADRRYDELLAHNQENARELSETRQRLEESEEREKAEAPREIYYAERLGYAGPQPWIRLSEWRRMRRRAESAEQRLKVAEGLLEFAEGELTNLQPHIAQLPKHYQPFIDSHIDVVLEKLRAFLKESEPHRQSK